jgi:phytanoyl-CoA hydroxylase
VNTCHVIDGSAVIPEELRERYRADGFVVIDRVLGDADVAALRAAVESDERTACYREAEGTVHLLGITQMHPAFLALAFDARILDIVSALIGPDIVLMHSKLAAKPLRAGQGAFPWHQDGAFYPHTNADVPSVMVMLDDATPDNGCMSMLRGSHRLGYLDHHDAEGWFAAACSERVWERQPQEVVAITPRAGGISIHSPLTLHGSHASRNGAPRRGLTYAYRAADSQQLGEDIMCDTGLVVRGAFRGQVRCEGFVARLPRFRHGCVQVEYGSAWHQVGPFAREHNVRRGLHASGLPKEAPMPPRKIVLPPTGSEVSEIRA